MTYTHLYHHRSPFRSNMILDFHTTLKPSCYTIEQIHVFLDQTKNQCNPRLEKVTFTFSHLADAVVQSDVQGREQSS